MDTHFDEEQKAIVERIDMLLEPCKGKGPSWGRYKGDVVCRVVAEHIQEHLPSSYKVVGPSVYIEGFSWELDLMVVPTEAVPLPYTNAYPADQVRCIMEIKKHGIYGKREELEQVVRTRIKSVFDTIVQYQPQIRPMYLAIEETVNPIKAGAIRYADITRKALYPYLVYILQDTRGKQLQKGEWGRFVNRLCEGIA